MEREPAVRTTSTVTADSGRANWTSLKTTWFRKNNGIVGKYGRVKVYATTQKAMDSR
jgi:hypothetical protein